MGWRRNNRRRLAAMLPAILAVGSGVALGQWTASTPVADVDTDGNPRTVEAALRQMTDRAAVIFVGTVGKVTRIPGEDGGPGVVQIEFGVEQAVRGCAEGTTYTLREWGGLWVGADQRYVEGQRRMMMLHAPSVSGLSSPVNGAIGAISVHGGGGAVGTAAAAGEPMVDLRWVGTKVVRPVVYRTTPAQVRGSLASKRETTGQADAAGDGVAEASRPAQEASVTAVLGMMATWVKVVDAH